jgi:Tol biopolymer transport system component
LTPAPTGSRVSDPIRWRWIVNRAAKITVATALITAAPFVPIPGALAAFPGTNGDIAFNRLTNQQYDIWAVDGSSTSTVRLTRTKRANEDMPDWSADGTKIAYSRCGRGELSNCDIWVMDADGSNPTRLTTTPDAQETWPAWSPDGTKIAYTSNLDDPFQDIYVMDADGSNQTRLTSTSSFDAFPEWSPDGAQIAFTSDRSALDDIYVMDADGSNQTRVTNGRKIDERPDWSPDGTTIVFSRNGNDIWSVAPDGTGLTQITFTENRDEFAPTYSPDGTKIAFDRVTASGRLGVWIINSDGTGATQQTFGKQDLFPDWEPS